MTSTSPDFIVYVSQFAFDLPAFAPQELALQVQHCINSPTSHFYHTTPDRFAEVFFVFSFFHLHVVGVLAHERL
jgi:hypothetical protein